ncbi:9741_t:CDS:2 [Paraglomus occultum]|uniref:9741_t:CDS:1 n=1 Tax=Paraglomus occultum TaxID=144539 RepID=A0A9N9EXZ3_9GLOM|nr:9741_t:CDS:2 [Paraglomus occultum]
MYNISERGLESHFKVLEPVISPQNSTEKARGGLGAITSRRFGIGAKILQEISPNNATEILFNFSWKWPDLKEEVMKYARQFASDKAVAEQELLDKMDFWRN